MFFVPALTRLARSVTISGRNCGLATPSSSSPNPILITHLADLSVCEVDLKHVFR